MAGVRAGLSGHPLPRMQRSGRGPMTLARVAAIWHLSPARLIDRAHRKRSSGACTCAKVYPLLVGQRAAETQQAQCSR